MPHVVLSGTPDIEKAFLALPRINQRDGTTVLKTAGSYLEREKGAFIIEGLALENGRPLNFLILVSKRDDGLVVRLHPSLDVEKSDGVKRMLALVAMRIMAAHPGTAVGKTNLQQFLV